MLKRSPLAPTQFPAMPAIAGVRLAVYPCNVKYKNRNDMLVGVMDEGTVVAGVFTKSATASANILWARRALEHKHARVLVVNAGNANAFNGDAGFKTIERITQTCASLWLCPKEQVYPCATGVIGQPMPDDKIRTSLEQVATHWQDASWEDAATAIGTTDTFPKGASKAVMIGGKQVTICGVVKGSGMIAPNMATMLAYLFTDATIAPDVLQQILTDNSERSFNAITVDSDTSTSDTVLLFATGKSPHTPIKDVRSSEALLFKEALFEVMLDLALQVIKDGEGATKLVEIEVTGAKDDASGKQIGLSIANSPLVKTAITGSDANWGRIIMAIGKAGEPIDADQISISIGGHTIVTKSQLNPSYDETPVTRHMEGDHILIHVDVGVGKGSSKVWTCNLSHAYIDINGDYRS